MQEVVSIKFRDASKSYYFDGGNLNLKKGDKVLVDSAGVISLGTVSEEKKLINKSELEEPLKKVIRIATKEDLEKIDELKEKANKQLPIIEEKIKNLKLVMNIVDVEYSFDETKITIFYTSDGRVDFRELLKVLASSLRVKIELRQIGTRDEVKMIGGLGLCGMPCCCTRFLKEPEHVTVKMVKNQNLSMSPTKTGGLCGRMMCCLAYEDKQYKELIANLPPIGEFKTMPDGVSGTVVSHDVLGQKFTIKQISTDGSFKLKEYALNPKEEEKEETAKKPAIENKEQKSVQSAPTTEEKPEQKPEKKDKKFFKHKRFNKNKNFKKEK